MPHLFRLVIVQPLHVSYTIKLKGDESYNIFETTLSIFKAKGALHFPKIQIWEVNSGSQFREIEELLYFPKLKLEIILAFLNIFCLISV